MLRLLCKRGASCTPQLVAALPSVPDEWRPGLLCCCVMAVAGASMRWCIFGSACQLLGLPTTGWPSYPGDTFSTHLHQPQLGLGR
jgi:hypothetical protein